jgi:hypothetical protein
VSCEKINFPAFIAPVWHPGCCGKQQNEAQIDHITFRAHVATVQHLTISTMRHDRMTVVAESFDAPQDCAPKDEAADRTDHPSDRTERFAQQPSNDRRGEDETNEIKQFDNVHKSSFPSRTV